MLHLSEPLPKPAADEQQSAYVSRCIAFVKGENNQIDTAQAAAMCYRAWRGRNEGAGDRREASDAAWSTVDKSKLPASCFLWVEDPEKKATWHLPVYMGAGGIDPDSGMYRQRGEVNLNALRAAAAAVAGARTGQAMHVPASVKAKLEALLKANKIGQESAHPASDLARYHESRLDRRRGRVSHLVETVDFSEAEFVEDGNIRSVRNVVLLGPQSSHGYEYRQQAMANAVGKQLYEGVRIFINHAGNGDSRSPMELAGVFRQTRHEGGKIRGTAHLLDDDWGRKFFNIAKHMPEAASCSHIADGKLVKSTDGDYVEEITKVHSVDLVVQGATTSSVFESHMIDDKGDPTMEYGEIKLDDLRAARPDIAKALRQEGADGRDDEVQTLVTECEVLKAEKAQQQAKIEELQAAETTRQKEAIVAAVMQAELPEHARTDGIKALCMAVQTGKDGFNEKLFEAKVKELVQPIKAACEGGGVKNMGGDKDLDESKVKQTSAPKIDEAKADAALTL